MQYSLINGSRNEAFPGGKGTCPACGADTLAKCGPRVIHHWAHARLQDCDPWWENETPWHRDWKNIFPPEWREDPHVAPDGEIHRADIKTAHGIVVELQHSSITDAERLSRERFYGNLVWVLDGRDFRKNFDIYHKLPDPTSELARISYGARPLARRKERPQVSSGVFPKTRAAQKPKGATASGGCCLKSRTR